MKTIEGSIFEQAHPCKNFLMDSWLKNYKHSDECKYMHTSVYKNIFWEIIRKEIINSKVKLITDNDDKIRSYIVYEDIEMSHESQEHTGPKTVIKYLYTTSNARHNGLAKTLLKDTIGDSKWAYCSFVTKSFVSFCHRHKYLHMYVPNLRR